MSLSQIRYMDIIPNTTAVRGIIIRSEDFDIRSFAGCGIQDQWDDVGFGIVAFPDLAFGIGSGRIENLSGRVPRPIL